MSNLPVPADWLIVTTVGVEIKARPTLQAWLSEMEFWLTMNEMSPIVIGDLLTYGEQWFPEEWPQAIDAFTRKYKAQTIANYKSTMGRIPLAVRHPQLSYGHYEAVAALPPEKRDKVLEQAVENKLGREETRALARQEKGREALSFWHAEVCSIGRELRSEGDTIVLEGVGSEDGELPEGAASVTVRGI